MTQPPDYLTSSDNLKALIADLSPEWRVRVSAMLADARLRGWLVETADAAAAAMVDTDGETYAHVADTLGVAISMVARRVTRHRQRLAEETLAATQQ